MPLAQRLYFALADGLPHSGQRLAATLGVTRSAVWKTIKHLRELGLDIGAATRRGYQLQRSSPPLDANAILKHLSPETRSAVRHAQVAWSIESTNSELLAVTDLPQGRCDFLLSEYQTAGRGRRARSWFAPPGGAICFSLSWNFASLPADAGALSLAVGVAVLRALGDMGSVPARLKWPNDLVVADRKLGGILIELRAEAAGPAYVVVGIGINVALGAALPAVVRAAGTEPIDLEQLGIARSDRNQLAAALVTQLVKAMRAFERDGFAAFSAGWIAADALQGRPVTITRADEIVAGVADGIEANGALRVRTADGLRLFNSGEVSVRAQP